MAHGAPLRPAKHFPEQRVQILQGAAAGLADEIARSVLYLASEQSSFVTGTLHMVDGGMSV